MASVPYDPMSNGVTNQQAPAPVLVPDAWNFAASDALLGLSALSVRAVLGRVKAGMDQTAAEGSRAVIPLGHGDHSAFPCFRTASEAVEAVAGALRSGRHNSYPAAGVGLEPARCSIARHLSGCPGTSPTS